MHTAAPPRGRPLVGFMPEFMRDPLALLDRMKLYGDLVPIQLGMQRTWLVLHPELVRAVLVTKQRSTTKSRFLKRAKSVLGSGLLTSEGDFHTRQRRLVSPAFHRQRLEGYADDMVRGAERTRERWSDGASFDLAREMMRLTLGIVAKTLFAADVEDEAGEIGGAITDVLKMFNMLLVPFGEWLEMLPIPSGRRARNARMRLDTTMYGIIAERRASGVDHGDLLSMLLMAQDEDDGGRPLGQGEVAGGMSDKQVRDESMTLFLAGHETTANALTWTFYLLSQHPEIEAALHAEVDSVLGGRRATAADFPHLTLCTRVFSEALRLYPPAWIISRLARETFTLGDTVIRHGDLMILSQWVVHRDERWYPDATRFDPARWDESRTRDLPRLAYFPFGGGPRVCVGEHFAWMEGVLVLATLAQRWRLRYTGDAPPVPKPLVTLRPRDGMPMRALPRNFVSLD